MARATRFIFMLLVCAVTATVADARRWRDTTGSYSIEADLVGFDDESVILQRPDKQLGRIRIENLSKADQEYLKTRDAEIAESKTIDQPQTWKTTTGVTIIGRVVDYTKKDVTIQRRRAKIYVGDRVITNLPDVYRQLLPWIVAHFEKIEPTQQAFRDWIVGKRGQPVTLSLEGVVFEITGGNEYSIPFFMFSEEDQKILRKGWKDWVAVKDKPDKRDDEAFRLEARMAAYKKEKEVNRRIAEINLQAVKAGVFSLWEVTLYPIITNPAPPRWAVYATRESEEAIQSAMRDHPGYEVGTVRRIRRR